MEEKLKKFYEQNYIAHGESERSLGWTKGKQYIRFHNLTKYFNLQNSEVVDIGCGFGDILNFFKANNFQVSKYTGIDLMEEFVKIGMKNHSGMDTRFVVGNYLKLQAFPCDIVVASGIFGQQVGDTEQENYGYVESVFKKAFAEAKVGISFDFISDKTDFKSSNQDFHASPSKILDLAYKFSRNVILDNSTMPFEFSITIFKDDSFRKEKTVFEKFIQDHEEQFKEGKL